MVSSPEIPLVKHKKSPKTENVPHYYCESDGGSVSWSVSQSVFSSNTLESKMSIANPVYSKISQ